jgi:ribonuclease T1
LLVQASECYEYPADVPRGAYILHDYVKKHNLTPPKGYKGGKIFRDRDGVLAGTIGADTRDRLKPWREYDLYPMESGKPRRAERIVVGALHEAAFYSPDHYKTFLPMYTAECLLRGPNRLPAR